MCLLLRAGAQAGDIAEKAAPDRTAVLGQLIVGAAVNGAIVQLHIGVGAAVNSAIVQLHIAVSAALHTNVKGVIGIDAESACDRAVQQIHRGTAGIDKGHVAADRTVQNVLCFFIFNAGNGQALGGIVVAPAGTGQCHRQTGSAELDLDHLIICFRVRTNILMLVFRAVSDAVGFFRRGRKPCPCICKCGYREDGEHHTERQYHAHDAFFHDILSFVG